MELNKRTDIVLTLDAGGTNFVFSAIRAAEEIVKPVSLPANGNNLTISLENIIKGFNEVKKQLSDEPVAISFAFPAPADYPNGIIGDCGNLTAFRGGIALAPMLEDEFKIPVFINNDGDLFAYGEAIMGFLPAINQDLERLGISRKYNNLLGVTLGTGFGAGIVHNGQLYLGDNSAGAEIWVSRSGYYPEVFAEENISIRAVQRMYALKAGIKQDNGLSPKDIYLIAQGLFPGNMEAARWSFNEMGKVLGDVLANAITLLDCNVVIGGGLSNAYPFFAPAMLEQLNGKISTFNNSSVDRLEIKAFDLENEESKANFFSRNPKLVTVPNSNRKVLYNWQKQIGVGLSKLGTSKAVAIGAYAFALNKIA